MDLDDFIITVFCLVDEAIPATLNGQRLRKRGPQPTLADSEVLTMEVVGEYLGLAQDSALFAYFRRHYAHFFPALRSTRASRRAVRLGRQFPLACLPLRPRLPLSTLPWRGRLRQGPLDAPNLLRLPRPRPAVLAWCHDTHLLGASQCV